MENDLTKLVRVFDVMKTVTEQVPERAYDVRAKGRLDNQLRAIMAIPAVDAVEVVHGHWITAKEALAKGDYSLAYTCSVCGHCDWDCTESESFNYCPNCGARMDGKEKHNGE